MQFQLPWGPRGFLTPVPCAIPVEFISLPRNSTAGDALGTPGPWNKGHRSGRRGGCSGGDKCSSWLPAPFMLLRDERRLRAAFTPVLPVLPVGSSSMDLSRSVLQLGISSCGHRELTQGSRKHPQGSAPAIPSLLQYPGGWGWPGYPTPSCSGTQGFLCLHSPKEINTNEY